MSLYTAIIKSRLVSQLIDSSGHLDALPAITMLRKLCNHPLLIAGDLDKNACSEINPDLLSRVNSSAVDASLSGLPPDL